MKALGVASLGLALLARAVPGAAEKPQRWIEVRGAHFVVVTNAGEKQGERVADHFEQIRAVFQRAFPRLEVNPSTPILIIAAKGENTFRQFEPEEWLQQGAAQRNGMFLRGPEENYVLLRLDVAVENAFRSIYHEYTHLLTGQGPHPLPLWLDEGLAEFYGNTSIHDKEVWLGEPVAEHVLLLRNNRLMPLPDLYAVDHNSPWYNEQSRTSVFYAESWLLTHYLVMKSVQEGKPLLKDFLTLVDGGADSVSAAARAFGDQGQLQRALQNYLRQPNFPFLRLKGSTGVDADFKLRELAPGESAAIRGDYMVANRQYAQAQAMLEQALAEDPGNADARAGLGLLYLQQGRYDEAGKWFTQAVERGSERCLANYYFAVRSMRERPEGDASPQVERSLRTAIRANPAFAPAYHALAAYYVLHNRNPEEAHLLALKAITLDPSRVSYYVTGGSALLRMRRPDDAKRVAEHALALAKSDEERAAISWLMNAVRRYQEDEAETKRRDGEALAGLLERQVELGIEEQPQSQQSALQEAAPSPGLLHQNESPAGERDVVEGRVTDVRCGSAAQMEVWLLDVAHRTVALHASNYFKIEYSAVDFTPNGELKPCSQIQGLRARILYTHPKENPNVGEIISVQLEK